MRSDLFWIPGRWPGRLAIAARPRGGDWLADEASAWQRAGINVVVSLLEDYEAAQLGLAEEPQAAENHDIGFISFPISDRGVPASIEAAMAVLGSITAQLREGKNVAVHCRQGIGRSGLVATSVLMSSGLTAEQAIEIVSAARGVSVPETLEQRRWIEHLPSPVPVSSERRT